MWKAVLALLACATLVAGAAASRRETGPTTRTTVYFLTDGGTAPIGVRRTIPRRSPFAREALAALLAGPSADERRAGLTSAIPEGTTVRSLEVVDSTHAFVDLSMLPAGESGVQIARVVTQLVRTLVGVSGIERVTIRSGGEPWGFPLMTGGVGAGPFGYGNLPWRVCAAKPGTEAVEGDCFQSLP